LLTLPIHAKLRPSSRARTIADSAVENATEFKEKLTSKIQIVHSLFRYAAESADLLVPILVTAHDEMLTSAAKFKIAVEEAQGEIHESRAR
jgi:hypothetical protein